MTFFTLPPEETAKRPYCKGGHLTDDQKNQTIELIQSGTPPSRIPEILKVSKHTINNSLKTDKVFLSNYEDAKRWGFAELVEEALLLRACGGLGNKHVTIEKRRKYSKGVALDNPDGSPMMEVVKETEHHYPPDNGAMALWLRANLPDKYNTRDKLEVSYGQSPSDPVNERQSMANQFEAILARQRLQVTQACPN